MAAPTASGQPLHTKPPLVTMPVTRNLTSRLSMESPLARRSFQTGGFFDERFWVNFTKFFLRVHGFQVFSLNDATAAPDGPRSVLVKWQRVINL
jgi:hypothetical protein